jgi:hypothetical protein
MKVKQTLTKENFWDGMTVRFPKSMKMFGKWIDDYKKEVDWNSLFNAWVLTYPAADGKESTILSLAKKFHEIPYAMQQGIWIEFAKEFFNRCGRSSDYDYIMDLADDVQEKFAWIESLLNES